MSRFANIAIPVICTTDVAQIAAQIISEYESDFLAVQQIAKTLAPGDPVRLILLRMAARESQYRSLLNYTFQQYFIISAVGSNLDAWGANLGSGNTAGTNLSGARLSAAPATTLLQFTLSPIAPLNVNVPIPVGTTAATTTTGAVVTFATTAVATIITGQTSTVVPATCTQTGIIGNGYTAGQINQLVGYTLPFVITVSNTTTTQGGGNIESDDAYAQRLALIPGAFSCAGPVGAYQFWGRSVSASIIDVSVVTPDTTPSVAAGNISLYFLLGPAGGGATAQIPNSGFLAQAQAVMGGPIRPLGDLVACLAPTVTNYNITGTYYIEPTNVVLQPTIDAAIQQALVVFNQYTSSRIGRTIDPAYLTELIIQAGASDVVLTAPTRTVLDIAHVGMQSGTMSMTYAGTEI